MKRQRIGILVLLVVLVGAACVSWQVKSSSQPSSPAATNGDRVGTQPQTVPPEPTRPEPGNASEELDRVGAETAGPESVAPQPRLGILGRPAPSLQIDRWYNLPVGKTSINVTDYRGKVLYLYGFQSWCPGCHRHGFPTLAQVIEHYENNDNLAFIAVQTAFEGFSSNTPERAKQTADRYGLIIPVGHSGLPRQPSPVMRSYRTGGTPWVVIIDRAGTVRFNDFHLQPDIAVAIIDRLLGGDSGAGDSARRRHE